MTEHHSMSPVVYDAANRELKTVRDYFAQRRVAVLDIAWQARITEGARIIPHQFLARIRWDGEPEEFLTTPADCAGTIVWLNERIPYELLHRRSEVLLRLAAGL